MDLLWPVFGLLQFLGRFDKRLFQQGLEGSRGGGVWGRWVGGRGGGGDELKPNPKRNLELIFFLMNGYSNGSFLV